MGVIDTIKSKNPATKININSTVGDLLTKGGFSIIDLIFFFVGLAFFISLVIAGWQYLLSSGDPKKISSASSRITNGFIGIVIVFASWLIVRFLSSFIGFDAGLI